MTTETKKLVYTVDEVGKILGISRNLSYKLCREKKLPGVIFLGSRRMVISVAAIDRLTAGADDSPSEPLERVLKPR
ncbi:hypothetical protein ES708_12117 [subsurface metagenome]